MMSRSLNRRRFIPESAIIPLLGACPCPRWPRQRSLRRDNPPPGSARSEPGWPSEASWNKLGQDVGGRLIKVQSPLSACGELLKELKNPYYIGDHVGLTQTLGWADAWTSRPSAYAVAAAE